MQKRFKTLFTMLGGINAHARNHFKDMMIDAQIASEMPPPRPDKEKK